MERVGVFELLVYPCITHAFATPFPNPVDVLGHHLVYDAKTAQDAQQRADAFIAAHLK
jgi:dienelactone hydrolase